MDWLVDKVYAVRQGAMNAVKTLIQTLGATWAEKNIMT